MLVGSLNCGSFIIHVLLPATSKVFTLSDFLLGAHVHVLLLGTQRYGNSVCVLNYILTSLLFFWNLLLESRLLRRSLMPDFGESSYLLILFLQSSSPLFFRACNLHQERIIIITTTRPCKWEVRGAICTSLLEIKTPFLLVNQRTTTPSGGEDLFFPLVSQGGAHVLGSGGLFFAFWTPLSKKTHCIFHLRCELSSWHNTTLCMQNHVTPYISE